MRDLASIENAPVVPVVRLACDQEKFVTLRGCSAKCPWTGSCASLRRRTSPYFFIEFAVALAIGSVSLFADSIDFLEDASVNLLIAVAPGRGPRNRARLGMALAWGVFLVPALAMLWTAWEKLNAPIAPEPLPLSLAGLGALAVNGTCALMLARFRRTGGSLTRAAFLSARNDALANIAIIAAGAVTAFVWRTAWPDMIVGLGIAAMNADAAREVWEVARDEHREANSVARDVFG